MCFDDDARPPLPPIRGGAIDARDLHLASGDGTQFAAYAARAERRSGAGIAVIPDVRGLNPYYEELTLRFAEAGVNAVSLDLYARTAGPEKRAADFEYEPHVLQLDSGPWEAAHQPHGARAEGSQTGPLLAAPTAPLGGRAEQRRIAEADERRRQVRRFIGRP